MTAKQGNGHRYSNLPVSGKELINTIRTQGLIICDLAGKRYALCLYKDLVHSHAHPFNAIPLLSVESSSGHHTARSLNYLTPLTPQAAKLGRGQYITLTALDQEDNIVVFREEDIGLITNYSSVKIFDTAHQIPENIDWATFERNIDIIFKALSEREGRFVNVIDGQSAFRLSMMRDYWKMGFEDESAQLKLQGPDYKSALPELKKAARDLKTKAYLTIRVADLGDFLATPNDAHKYFNRNPKPAKEDIKIKPFAPQSKPLRAIRFYDDFWQNPSDGLMHINSQETVGIILDKEGCAAYYILPSKISEVLSDSNISMQLLPYDQFANHALEWLEMLGENDALQIEAKNNRNLNGMMIFSGRFPIALAHDLGFGAIVEEEYKKAQEILAKKEQETIKDNKIRRLKFIDTRNFSENVLSKLEEVNKSGIPLAIRDENNEVAAIIMPLKDQGDLQAAIGSTVADYKKIKDPVALLHAVQDESRAVEIHIIGNGARGILISGSYETRIAQKLPDGYYLVEDKPANNAQEGKPAVQKPPTASIASVATPKRTDIIRPPAASAPERSSANTVYTYRECPQTMATVKVAELREHLKAGIVCFVASNPHGVLLFIPEQLVHSASQIVELKRFSSYSFIKQYKDKGFIGYADPFLGYIVPGERPAGFSHVSDKADKTPYGFVNWPLALMLEEKGIIPPIPVNFKRKATSLLPADGENYKATQDTVAFASDFFDPNVHLKQTRLLDSDLIQQINNGRAIKTGAGGNTAALIILPARYEGILRSLPKDIVEWTSTIVADARANFDEYVQDIEPNEIFCIESQNGTKKTVLIFLHPNPVPKIIRALNQYQSMPDRKVEAEQKPSVPTAPAKADNNMPSIAGVTVGKIVKSGDIAANLARLQAEKQLAETVGKIREQLRRTNNPIKVPVGQKCLIVISDNDLADYAPAICGHFNMHYAKESLIFDGDMQNLYRDWSSLFNRASQIPNAVIVVYDEELKKDVVILPDNKKFIEEDLPVLGINIAT